MGERSSRAAGEGRYYLAFCLAQRLRCAAAILARASGLSTRFFAALTLAGAFACITAAFVVTLPRSANKARACFSLAISASISVRMFSIAMQQGYSNDAGFEQGWTRRSFDLEP